MYQKYRERGQIFEAVKLTEENAEEVAIWCSGQPMRMCTRTEDDRLGSVTSINIQTEAGSRWIREGSYVIRNADGSFSKCDPEVFEREFEPIPQDEEKIDLCVVCSNIAGN